MNPIRVLIIDDEEDMRNLVQMYLENSGFQCVHASNGKDALIRMQDEHFDLVILDIMMPFEDGYVICGKIRAINQVPIIFLSAKGEEWDKVRALQLGGDDYIVKPFSPGELVARIHAVLRRTIHAKNDDERVTLGKITIDKKGRRVSVEGEAVPLTLKEFELLVFLVQHQGQALSREQLLEFVWGMDYHGSLRTVDTHIKTLRMKLGTGDYIQTIWGVGYKFEVPES